MSFERCMAAMGRAIGRRISLEEGEVFAERLEQERARLGFGPYPADYLAAARAVREAEEIAAANARRHVLLNRIAFNRLTTWIEAMEASGVDSALALEAKRVGINTPIPGGRESVAALHEAIRGEAWGAIIADLRAPASPGGPRLFDLFMARDFEEQIVKAARGEPDADPRAQRIFEALDRVREVLRRRENRAGSMRGRLEGFAAKHHWEPRLVERIGFEEFRRDFLNALDHDRTFNPDEGRQTALIGERNALSDQIAATERELVAIRARLSAERRRLRQRENTAQASVAREDRLEGHVAEGRRAMGAALQRYMDLAARQRALRDLTPLEAGSIAEHERMQAGAKRAGDARLEARVALGRERARLAELHDRLQRERQRGDVVDAKAEDTFDDVQEALRDLERAEKGLDLLNELEAEMGRLQGTLRRAVTDRDGFLREAFNNIVSDQWRRSDRPRFEGVVSFSGPGNLANRRSNAHRVFHFKSAADELAMMRKYSRFTLSENILMELDQNARVIALMEEFGPNPERMHAELVDWASERAERQGDRRLLNRLHSRTGEYQMAELLGKTQAAHNETLAAYGSAIRAVQSMAKLGAAVASSLGDVVTLASELKYQGRGAFDGYMEGLAGLVRGRPAADKQRLLDLVNVGNEVMTGTVMARLQGNEHLPGRISKMQQLFFRLNLLGWWTDTHKRTATLVTAHDFANAAGEAFDALVPERRRLLELYGIDARGWDILRRYGVETHDDSRAFLTAEGARRAPLGEFMLLAVEREPTVVPSERAMLQARDRLASQWVALLKDRADFAVPTPGARERAIMNMGTERGTVLGEGLRFLMQFKGFPIAMVSRVLGRETYGYGEGPVMSAVARLGVLIGQLTAMGLLSLQAKELLKGRDARPLGLDTLLAAAVQGGGLGLYGDFLFGEFNRFGRSALNTAAGPTFGAVDDVLEIWARLRSGDDAAAQAMRFAVSNTPFANLFYVRPALDWFVLWPLSEKLNPGWAARFERRVARENHNTFWLRPTEAVR